MLARRQWFNRCTIPDPKKGRHGRQSTQETREGKYQLQKHAKDSELLQKNGKPSPIAGDLECVPQL
jgi:hypothetical protein